MQPDSIAPPTPTERLEAILARSDTPVSATTQIAALRDPGTLLAAAAAQYQDAIIVAAERYSGPRLVSRLDETAEELLPGLTEADAWPVARSHLLVLNADGIDPIGALQHAIDADGLQDAHDRAAVIDHRLDITGARTATRPGPLPWLPHVPQGLTDDQDWGPYLAARHQLVSRLAEDAGVSIAAAESVPAWAAALVRPPSPEVIGQIELWRAAHQIPDSDLRPTGPVQHRLLEARAQHRLDALLAGESEPVLTWLSRIHQVAPGTIDDPATIRLARECAEVDPDGHSLPRHLEHALERPLPDDHKADALRYRLEAWLHPVWEVVRTAEPHHDFRHQPPPSLGRHPGGPAIRR